MPPCLFPVLSHHSFGFSLPCFLIVPSLIINPSRTNVLCNIFPLDCLLLRIIIVRLLVIIIGLFGFLFLYKSVFNQRSRHWEIYNKRFITSNQLACYLLRVFLQAYINTTLLYFCRIQSVQAIRTSHRISCWSLTLMASWFPGRMGRRWLGGCRLGKTPAGWK